MFEHVEPYAGDPIFALVDAFNADPRPHKVNLSIGIYFDDDGRIPVLGSVRAAEQRLLAQGGPKPYLPMEGAPEARRAVQQLLFGPSHEALASGRVATIQSVGSSGGLKVGADFLKRWFPGSGVWISDPSWDNHRSMFEGSGFTVKAYPYYDAASGGVRFAEMLAAIEQLPARSIVLLHACCHNPTGVDLTHAQWDQLIPVLKRRELIGFLDLAYQGYGDGLEEDAYAVRALAASGAACVVANSFSKSMSVYGERCGALSVVCPTAREAELVLGQLKLTVRRIYSSPAIHAAGIMALVLGDALLRAQWESEVTQMRERIRAMRKALHEVLSARVPG
ncbi:MAG TPA: amino acid aminotransferase, partial [Burkholderiaceae bacterium]|nr:amino acid aminotransferase [Burkholderiaceae bacterium]